MNLPKSILITGASSGIGEALALEYATKAVFLFLCGRNAERLDVVAGLCREKGAIVETEVLDVTDAKKLSAWIIAVDEQMPLELVIANAGISLGSNGYDNAKNLAQDRLIFDVNLNGVLNTVQPILPRMVERNSGQVAVMSSLAGFRGWPTAPSYSASKGAVRFYGEALRGELAHTGVKINVICPGFVKSRMTDINDFPMPFLMEVDKAARIIVKGLFHNKGRIAFPWQTYFFSWFLSIFPDFVAQKIMAKFPRK